MAPAFETSWRDFALVAGPYFQSAAHGGAGARRWRTRSNGPDGNTPGTFALTVKEVSAWIGLCGMQDTPATAVHCRC